MPSDMVALRGRHALVTGSSSGIGGAIAQHLLDDGWQVTGLDVMPASIQHSDFKPLQVDLLDGVAIDLAMRALPSTQALVHAAGVLRLGRITSAVASHHDDAQTMWQLHVAAASRLAAALLPRMAAQGFGRVVLVGSRVAQGKAGRGQYAATKAALISLARSWAAEVVSQGVTVNVVSPAATQTAMTLDPARSAAVPFLPPIGRLIAPQEVAALVAFLLGPQAAAITGQDIQVCGGASLPL